MEKKERSKAVKPIGEFKSGPYRDMMKKYKYHYPHMKILSRHQTLKERKEAFLGDINAIFSERDYAEAVSLRFNKEIHGDNFGYTPSLVMEGSTLTYHNTGGEPETHFYTYFSDDAKQHSSTTYENMHCMLKDLQEKIA